jgi:5'-3' exonuclease
MKALNIACISVPGYEADDIIATYARIAESQGHKVCAFSIFTLIDALLSHPFK